MSANGYEIESTKLLNSTKGVKYKSILKNVDDLFKYTLTYLVSGKTLSGRDVALGENYFIESGTCDESSSSECVGRKKHIYVRNIPTGSMPPAQISFNEFTGCNLQGLTEMRGIIPGMVEDIYDINPYEVTKSMIGSGNIGSNSCKRMKLPVGKRIYDNKNLSDDTNFETKCTSSFFTKGKTTSNHLNEKIRLFNKDIPNAQMPSPTQLNENFTKHVKSFNHIRLPFMSTSRVISFIILFLMIFLVLYIFRTII